MVIIASVTDPDTHYFGKPDPDPQRVKKKLDPDPHRSQIHDPDPDPHQNQNSEALEAQNGDLEGRRRTQWRHRVSK